MGTRTPHQKDAVDGLPDPKRKRNSDEDVTEAGNLKHNYELSVNSKTANGEHSGLMKDKFNSNSVSVIDDNVNNSTKLGRNESTSESTVVLVDCDLPENFPHNPSAEMAQDDVVRGHKSLEEFPTDDVVQHLVENHLNGNMSSHKIRDLLRLGRPTPVLLSSDTIADPKTGAVVSLSHYTYQKIPWLTGSKTLGKYFCWPCLLFHPLIQWTMPGEVGWKEISITVLSHQVSPAHIKAFKTLKLRTNSLDPPKPQTKVSPEAVQKNRTLSQLLIRLLCSKKTKIQNSDDNFDGYEELMKMAILHSSTLKNKHYYRHGLSVFISTHAANLLSSIEHTLRSMIQKDIVEASHLSILYVDMANVVESASTVAVIVRYVNDGGEILERFLKLMKLSGPRTADVIGKIHTKLVNELNIGKKLVGFSYSGTVVTPFDVKLLNNTISKASPKTKYYHCPDFNFKELLLQSLSHVDQTKYFFHVINNLVEFFAANSGAIPTLVNFVTMTGSESSWSFTDDSFTYDIVTTIKQIYPILMQFFRKVSVKFWNDEVVRQAPEFVRFLKDPINKFLILVVAAILHCTEQLSLVVEGEFDSVVWSKVGLSTVRKLELLQRRGDFFVHAASSQNLLEGGSHLVHPELLGDESRQLFTSLIDAAIQTVSSRVLQSDTFYVGTSSANYTDIVADRNIRGRYVSYNFKSLPHLPLLKDQIDSFKQYELLFANKTVPEHIKHMKSLGIVPQFPDLHDFLKFALLAAPPIPHPAESKITQLMSYVKTNQNVSLTKVLLHLEKDSIAKLTKDPQFFEDVINHYAKTNPNFCK